MIAVALGLLLVVVGFMVGGLLGIILAIIGACIAIGGLPR